MQRKVGNHLLVGELIPLCALDHSVQNQHIAIRFTGNDVTTGKNEANWKDSNDPGLLHHDGQFGVNATSQIMEI